MKLFPLQIQSIMLIALLFNAGCVAEKTLPSGVPFPDIPLSNKKTSSTPRTPTIEAFPGDAPTLSEAEKNLKVSIESLRAGQGDRSLAITRRIADLYPDTASYKRSLFVAMQAFLQMERDAEAFAAMLRVQEEYPELGDYAVFLVAESRFAKGRFSEAAALYQQVRERYPESSLLMRSSYQGGRALMGANSYARAAEMFEKYIHNFPLSDNAPDAATGLGRALWYEARLPEAIDAFRRAWVRYAGSQSDDEAERVLVELKASGVEVPDYTPEELFERGRNLYRLNQYDKAAAAFTLLLERDPSSTYRAEVLFRTGVSLYNLGRRGEAAAMLESMIKDYPADPRTPEALYWTGKSYSKLGEWERGVKTFQKLLDRYPASEWADDALFLTGNIYRESGDMKKALRWYGRLVQEYPDSKFADSAIWWRAWSYYVAGDHKKAESALQELVNRYPRSFLVNQARYWLGRSAEKRNDPSRAIRYYGQVLRKGPYTYYGYRAAERKTHLETSGNALPEDDPADLSTGCTSTPCAEDPLNAFTTDDGPPVWTEETKHLLAGNPSYRRTLELMHLDMKKEAAFELWYLQDQMPRKRGMLIGLSKAFFELGDYHRSLMLVLRNYERYLEGPAKSVTEDLWLLAYPQGFWESIVNWSRKYGQDPFFIAAIIREESQFHPEALSPAGARGLMQVMPATGAWAARFIKLSSFDRSKLFDSDIGINIGTWYIGQLMKRFKNDPLLVAAAYNAGPEAAAAWVSRNGHYGERDMFVELIPYAETRGYVKKVLRNYAEYKRIYGRADGSMAQTGMLSPQHADQ